MNSNENSDRKTKNECNLLLQLCYKIKVIEIYIEFIFQCANIYSNFNLCIIISISIWIIIFDYYYYFWNHLNEFYFIYYILLLLFMQFILLFL